MPRTMALDEPLSEEEIDRLDEILLTRVDDDADTEGKDEGVLGISDLDGFLTAIVSAPVTLMPSRWLPALWGDFEPVWDSIDDYQEFMSLVMRHMNGIAGTLSDAPTEFEPLFMENHAVDSPALVVDEWCEGYVRAIHLAADEWAAAGAEMEALLAPILAFTSDTDWRGHDLDDSAEADRLREAITPSARAIHAYWLARRAPSARSVPAAATPIVRPTPRVGRNDPCPCGSGKKYKKCCLQ